MVNLAAVSALAASAPGKSDTMPTVAVSLASILPRYPGSGAVRKPRRRREPSRPRSEGPPPNLEALIRLGETYDSIFLRRIGLLGQRGDRAASLRYGCRAWRRISTERR
jgi:hypothetical protein